MINRELFRTAVYNKLIDQALTMIASEAFVIGLPFPIDKLNDEEIIGLEGVVGTAIANLGGAKKLLTNAMESVKTNPAKYRFVKSMFDNCHAYAMEAAAREAKELDPNEDFESALKKANFTEEELRRFETATDDLTIDEVGEIVSEKVIATIKSEQEAYEKEKALDQHIDEMLEASDVNTGSEEAANSAKESFYQMTLGVDNPRHPISLFSKMNEVALESLACLYPEEAEKTISIRGIEDLISFYTLKSYRREMGALESIERLINVDAAAINQNEFQEAALESLQNPACTQAAFVNATTAYTLMESLKTLNIFSPDKREIEAFINTSMTPASYGTHAVESFVSKAGELFKDLERNIRSTNTVDGLRDWRNQYSIIGEKLNAIGVASEAFLNCKHQVLEMIDKAKEKIDTKITALEANAPELGHDQKIAFEQDLAAVNRLYALYGTRPNVVKATFTIDTFKRENADIVDVAFVTATESVQNRSLTLQGVTESVNQYEYVKKLIAGSKFKENNKTTILHTLSGSNEVI